MKKDLLLLTFVFFLSHSAWADDFVVTDRADSGPGTLRDAVAQANAAAGLDNITFDLSGNSITVNSTVIVTDPVVIDGGGTQVIGGTGKYNSISILQLASGSDGSVIQNLSWINSFAGVSIFRSNNNRINNCRIGTNWQNMSGLGHQIGVEITDSSQNRVGGNRLANEGNIISGSDTGVSIHTNFGDDSYRGNSICGNVIGLNSSQTAVLPNSWGIKVFYASYNFIGVPEPGYENIIAGNSTGGINLIGGAYLNRVQNNWIGFNTSENIFPNSFWGICLEHTGCLANLIGGIGPHERNIICGSVGAVRIFSDATGNTITGNWIGLLPSGQVPASTGFSGIYIEGGASNNFIGTKLSGKGNLIANTQNGLYIKDATTTGNRLFGNTICAFSSAGIVFDNSASGSDAPVISFANSTRVDGTAQAYDYIEIFRAEPRPGLAGGSLAYAGGTSANAGGQWSIAPLELTRGDYVCALASDAAGNNTSVFSSNILVIALTPTVTPTSSPTATITPTFTNTAVPDQLRVFNNRIDPTKGETMRIRWSPPATGPVTIEIYNMRGELIKTLLKNAVYAGGQIHEAAWVGQNDAGSIVANGIYIVSLEAAGGYKEKFKVAVIKN